MKRFALAAALQVVVSVSVSLAQQDSPTDKAQPAASFRKGSISQSASPGLHSIGPFKDDRTGRFFSAFEQGQFVVLSEMGNTTFVRIIPKADRILPAEYRKQLEAADPDTNYYEVTLVGYDYIRMKNKDAELRYPLGSFVIVDSGH